MILANTIYITMNMSIYIFINAYIYFTSTSTLAALYHNKSEKSVKI